MALSKADQAFQILKERIMDGTYGPGHRLVIDQLVREHGISSVPWRESLRRLEAEGWVEIVPHVGALVRTFDTDAWKQTLLLVARLEGYATALSAPNLSKKELAQAHALIEDMSEALTNFDPTRFGQLNREFHVLLCSRCDFPRLNELLAAEWARLELIRRSAFWYAPGRAQMSVVEHTELLNVIESGASAEEIEKVARQHEINTVIEVERHNSSPAAGKSRRR